MDINVLLRDGYKEITVLLIADEMFGDQEIYCFLWLKGIDVHKEACQAYDLKHAAREDV